MAGRIGLRYMKECLTQKLKSMGSPVVKSRHLSSAASSSSSSSASAAAVKPKFPHSSRKGRLLTGATIGLLIGGGAYASTVDEATFGGWLFNATKVVNPFFALLDPEVAHRLAVTAASRGWVPRERKPDPQVLGLEVWGRRFSNPIGLSAGFDKNAEAVEGLLALGFGFVEVGSVTPIPQEGNPKPRIFRLREHGALINRCGFNSEGIVAVAKRLGAQHGKRKLAETSSTSTSSNDEVKQGGKAGPGILGVNIGKNKSSEDAAADYVQGVHTLSQYADYLVINISSPNTPGLRQLQGRKQLKDLVKKVQAARDEMQWAEEGPPPLLVKIAPDLSKQDLEDIAAVALALRLDGLIISNTTISRPEVIQSNPVSKESGGLSGKPLFGLSTDILKDMYILTKGKIPLIGCGGVSSGEDAYKKIRAGATLVQLYTAFAYGGPALIPQIKAELAQCLERDGFKSVYEAIGADCR
ncbi:dihydroorotate dehydrogenase, mitochondrial [Tanacetum coccineum]